MTLGGDLLDYALKRRAANVRHADKHSNCAAPWRHDAVTSADRRRFRRVLKYHSQVDGAVEAKPLAHVS